MAMFRQVNREPKHNAASPPAEQARAEGPRPRPARSAPRHSVGTSRESAGLKDLLGRIPWGTRGPQPDKRGREPGPTGAEQRAQQTATELASLRDAVQRAESLAQQAQQDARSNELARGEAEQRAQRAEAERAGITERLRAAEHLIALGVAERERTEAALAALATAGEWRRLLEGQRARIEKLVSRVRQLPEVRANPELAEELFALKGEDLRECVQVVGVVLEEALGAAAMAEAVPFHDLFNADPELLNRVLHSLEMIVDRRAAEGSQEVAVAPAADGTTDGEVGRERASLVDIRDSVGVVRGDNSDVNVIHLCEVNQPVVEIAELMKMGPDGPVFCWSSSAFEPGHVADSATSYRSNALSVDFWTNVWNSSGVAVGDNITMEVTRHHKIEGCRVNLRELLRDDDVRGDLALSRSDSPEAEAARQRLPDTVARAVEGADLSNLVPAADIASLAADPRPKIRRRGPRLVVTHGAGVGVGRNPDVSGGTITRVGEVHVK